MAEKERILFVCEDNTARSQMAEVLMRHHAGELFDVFSAGLAPAIVDSRAVSAMAEFGVHTGDLRSKPVQQFMRQEFDLLITLYSRPESEAEPLPPAQVRMSWHFSDPATEEETHTGAFVHCLQQLNERIKMLLLILTRRR